jgi:flagellar hook assembly protein FlgD
MIEHDGTLETDHNNYTIPNHVSISQNFPNPFNPETQFSYTLNESGTISLGIYDIMGKLIYTVYDGFQRAGNHNVLWSGLDQNKRPVSSGVYFYRLVTQSNTISKKMVLAK